MISPAIYPGDRNHPGLRPNWSAAAILPVAACVCTGGLPGLPYVLAQVEQEFIVPKNVQSLIWEDLVPSLMTSAVLPRWWQVTPKELHAVALYQQFGEDLLTSAGQDASLREKVVDILANRMLSRRLDAIAKASRRRASGDKPFPA